MAGVITRLTPGDCHFPSPERALDSPNGLLASGGDLRVETLIKAYTQGVFPWSDADAPLLWWSPDPRSVLFPERVHISRSLRREMRRGEYRLSADSAFSEVMRRCAGRPQTWISEQLRASFDILHRHHIAHSIEVWMDQALVGGLYGVAFGGYFAGESMFSLRDNASKLALACLCRQLRRWGFELIDCQISNPHLGRMGAEEIPRAEFLERLERAMALKIDAAAGAWRLDEDLLH